MLVRAAGTLAFAGVLALAGCTSTSNDSTDADATDGVATACSAFKSYQDQMIEKLTSLQAEAGADTEKQAAAAQEFTTFAIEKTKELKDELPENTPGEVTDALNTLNDEMEAQVKKGDVTDQEVSEDADKAQTTVTDFMQDECPELFQTGQPAPEGSAGESSDSSDSN